MATPVLGPGAKQHVARALCPHGHFIKWLPKSAFGGMQEGRIMGGIARCTVVGCVGKGGVEVRHATSGTPCASFMLVVSEVGTDGRTHELWVPCEVWGKKGEAAGELEPGQLIVFEGKLARRKRGETWELVVSGFDATPITTPGGGAERQSQLGGVAWGIRS
jgi:hypothetical protein